MYKLSAILLVLAVSSTNALAVINDSEIMERAGKVTANLTALNIIGRSCYVQLQVNGIKGAQSKECAKFLSNTTPTINKYEKDCTELNAWYDTKIAKPIKKSDELKMYEIHKACDNPERYAYIMPTVKLINAIVKMK